MQVSDPHLSWIVGEIEDGPNKGFGPPGILWRLIRYLAKWRSTLLGNAIRERGGSKVFAGPFAGMDYITQPAEGALAPRLLGCYERELHPYLARFTAEGIGRVLDIGCAEGYYAVGLARMAPHVVVDAFDINPSARQACAELAARNGVADRVRIGELFEGERFADYDSDTLVIVDIEGGELELLDPDKFQGLKRLAIIVETHPDAAPGATEILTYRFGATHVVERVDHAVLQADLPLWLRESNHLDLVLATYEWRGSATPWLVMTPRQRD